MNDVYNNCFSRIGSSRITNKLYEMFSVAVGNVQANVVDVRYGR